MILSLVDQARADGEPCSYCHTRPPVAMTPDWDYICEECAEPGSIEPEPDDALPDYNWRYALEYGPEPDVAPHVSEETG
jgi:hypothetical protein